MDINSLKTSNKIFLLMAGVAVASFVAISSEMLATNDAGFVQVKQAAGSGTMSVRTDPGVYLKMFSDIKTYKISDVFDFTKESDRLPVRFGGDGSTGWIEGQIKYRLPTDEENILKINTDFAKLWPMCRKQVTIRRELPEFGLSLQSRPDGLCLEHGFAVDVKSIANIDQIPKQTIDFAYDMQASISQWLLAQEGHQIEWFLAFVEKTEKPRTRMFRIPEVALSAAWQRTKRLVSEVARRTRDNSWAEEHPAEIPVMDLPEWRVRSLEKQLAEA